LRKKGPDKFFPWFSGGKSAAEAFARGQRTWNDVFAPIAIQKLSYRYDKIALDIGYGGGIHVAAAAEMFGMVYGVDVHEQQDFVTDYLDKMGKVNVLLKSANGSSIPFKDDTVDFAYSWTVFMHVGMVGVVARYLRELHRVMKEGGIGVLFCSRLIRSQGSGVQTLEGWQRDCKKEMQHHCGFWEQGVGGQANVTINLKLACWYFSDMIAKVGFRVIDYMPSGHVDEGGVFRAGGQHGVVFMK
jgi:SAM-dependent methyltransferase